MMSKRQSSVVVFGLLLLAGSSAGAQEGPAPFSEDVVIFATNSVWLKQNSDVLSGDVVVNDQSPGPTLASQRELTVGLGTTTPAGYFIAADSIKKKSSAVIGGDVFCNDGSGVSCSGLAQPVFAPPPFTAAPPRDGAPDVFIPIGGFEVLEPGDYATIEVKQNGTVLFTGGVYNVADIDSGIGTQLLFGAPSQVRVAGKYDLRQNGYIGPDVGAEIGASDIVVYVAGINGNNGKLGATPKAARNGLSSEVHANFYVPNGTLWLRQNSDSTGAFLGRDVILGIGATATLDSAFGNQPPTADPQNVATSGAADLEITLTGSDPEGGDLAFDIAVDPTGGTLGSITPIVPDPIPNPDPEGEPSQPPVVSATVTYTPNTGDDLEDAFTFTVTDPEGAIGAAVVHINPPPDVNPPPPPLDTVVANNGGAETQTTSSIAIRLNAAAPDEVSLTYAVLTLPTLGALTDSEDDEAAIGVPLPSPDLTYTAAGSAGVDSFDFEACGLIDQVQTCDTATFVVTVQEPPPLAEDQTVGTNANKPVDITLSGNPGGSTGQGRVIHISGAAAFIDGAEIAGNVADDDGDGKGDNHNDLPGPVPVLMAAGVDVSGGAGSNGTVRMQIEWDVTSYAGLVNDLVSATVTLNTSKGSVDSLDTFFYAGGIDQDGLLTDSDFEADAEQLSGVVMPVVAGQSTFSFDVTNELKDVLGAGFSFFSVQGRVDESLSGQGFQRGLQVFTTADGNLTSFSEPKLELTTPGVTPPPLTFTVLTLPAFGTLTDSQGSQILEVPAPLLNPTVTYTPGAQAAGQADSFQFQAFDGQSNGTGLVAILITLSDGCVEVGRDPGCAPGP